MILLDCTHTAHTRANSGIQRVCRGLHRSGSLRRLTQTVIRDKRGRCWRTPDRAELQNLDPSRAGCSGQETSEQGWSPIQKARGLFYRRVPPSLHRRIPEFQGAIFPEVFNSAKGPPMRDLYRRLGGPVVCIVHDIVPVIEPRWTTPYMRQHFAAYLEDVHQADGVAAVSTDTAESLRRYWIERRMAPMPRIELVPPGTWIEKVSLPADALEPADPPLLLSVATLEPRKNHAAMLEAIEKLWQGGIRFQVVFVGSGELPGAQAIIERISNLQRDGCPVQWEGQVSDQRLDFLYRTCTATLFPSLFEGFGIPVLESMAYGKPCLISNRGGLADRAAGGGCLTVDEPDAPALYEAMHRLLTDSGLRHRLCEEARARPSRTWDEYLDDLLAFTYELRNARGTWPRGLTRNRYS